jgi:hypothetical protein
MEALLICSGGQWEEKALVSAEKALALDPDLAVAHLARGRLLWTAKTRDVTSPATATNKIGTRFVSTQLIQWGRGTSARWFFLRRQH